MGRLKKHTIEFDHIALLIEEARNRAFIKVNEELVLLYFKVGNIVSIKIADGVWGEGIVEELAAYIATRYPGLSGFNRRGLYRMKQFYETYCINSGCYKLWLDILAKEGQNSILSPVATKIKLGKMTKQPIVSPAATQMQIHENQHFKFVSAVLTQITWTNHLEIFKRDKFV